jgi:hypothetical protein
MKLSEILKQWRDVGTERAWRGMLAAALEHPESPERDAALVEGVRSIPWGTDAGALWAAAMEPMLTVDGWWAGWIRKPVDATPEQILQAGRALAYDPNEITAAALDVLLVGDPRLVYWMIPMESSNHLFSVLLSVHDRALEALYRGLGQERSWAFRRAYLGYWNVATPESDPEQTTPGWEKWRSRRKIPGLEGFTPDWVYRAMARGGLPLSALPRPKAAIEAAAMMLGAFRTAAAAVGLEDAETDVLNPWKVLLP